MRYAIAEIFSSLQGEGWWVGTPMTFVRFSGCPVGGPNGICRGWDGRNFTCDTGASHPFSPGVEWHPYSEVNLRLTPRELYDRLAGTPHICLTGGEPLALDLTPLLSYFEPEGHTRIHIETSGTIAPDTNLTSQPHIWITISPKWGWHKKWIGLADEAKILVDKDTSEDTIIEEVIGHEWVPRYNRIFLQPIQDGCWKENTKRAVELCQRLQLRLSLQTHKLTHIR